MTKDEEIELLKKAYQRERQARKTAERILEEKALELYQANNKLLKLNESLESDLENRVLEVKAMANFYLENPNPVIRMNANYVVLFRNAKGLEIIAELEQNGNDDQIKFFYNAVDYCLENETELTQQSKIGNNYYQLTYIPVEKYVNIYGLDITQQVHAEEAKKESERRFKNYIESANEIVYQTNVTGIITYVNPAIQHITGYNPEELIGRSFIEFIDPDVAKELIEIYANQLKKSIKSTYQEFQLILKNGRKRWIGQTAQIFYNKGIPVGFLVFARDVQELKNYQLQLRRSEEKYRGIMENLELGLLEVDLDGNISKIYPSFCDLTGYSEQELIGIDPKTLLADEQSLRAIENQETLRGEGKSSVYEVKIRHKNGDNLWVLISGAPFYNLEGDVIGSIGVHFDITSRKKLEHDLQLANEQAMASSKAKEMFLANMSHEIRTPLNAVIGISQLMKKTELNPKQLDYLAKISTSADGLLLLVNDILDITKIEAGNMSLEELEVNLLALIKEVISPLEYSALEKDLGFNLNVENIRENACYFIDPLRISQILMNLISNAIKFTSSGDVTLSLIKLASENNKDIIRFAVSDTGIGMNEESQLKIFQEFMQAEQSTTRNYGGTGLGLSITKKLVELHGSELQLTSKLNEGSCFYFDLTLCPCVEKNKNTTIEAELNWEEIKIAVTEDNELNQFVIKSFLENFNIEPDIFNNGQELLDHIEQANTPYDLIFMDIQMPILDGVETTQRLRNNPNFQTPIIALTANTVKEKVENYLEIGMNDFMSKPFKEETLKAVLIKYLPNKIKTEHSDLINSVTINLDNLNQLSGGNKEFIHRMLSIFIDEGHKAVEDLKKLNDRKLIAKIAHKSKPSLDYIGNNQIKKLSRKIESETFNEEELKMFISLYIKTIAEAKKNLEKA